MTSSLQWPRRSPSRFELQLTTKVRCPASHIHRHRRSSLQSIASHPASLLGRSRSFWLQRIASKSRLAILSEIQPILKPPPIALPPQVNQLMTLAFADPIPAAKPLGFRFTVGGGKKVIGASLTPPLFLGFEPAIRRHAGARQVRRRYAQVVS